MRPRIVLADDHRMVAEGLRNLLAQEFEVVTVVEDGAAVVAAAEQWKPDVVVADISMPLMDGFEAAREIKKNDARTKIVFLTMHPEVSYAVRAFDLGASGYLLKQGASSELIMAIKEVLAGRTYVTPLIAGDLMQAYREMPARRGAAASLSPKRREVLEHLAEGHSIKEIAAIMHISLRTVQFHKYRVMEQLGIRSTADLTRYAIKNGIVSA